jgi:hypothetical protein
MICCLAANIPAQDKPAQDKNDGAARSKVLALESIWNMAEEKGDVRALDMIFDESMIYIDEDGTLLNKARFLAHVKASVAAVQSITTQTIGVHVYGETVVVAGTYRAKGLAGGKAYVREGRFMDTWVLRRGTWVCVVAQSTPILH